MKGKRCKGEDPCIETPRAPLWVNLNSESPRPIEDVCRACPVFKLKPGNEPPELKDWIYLAYDLDMMQSMGARFAYPDALTRLEWMALKTLGAARADAEEEEIGRRQHEAEKKSEENRIRNLVNQRSGGGF